MIRSYNFKNHTHVQLCYRKFPPCALLADYIQCYWTITFNNRILSSVINRVLPDGCIDIIFNLGDAFGKINQDCSVSNVPHSCVVGAMRQPIIAKLKGHIEIIGVRFKPGGAYPFFRFPLHELTNRIVALDDLSKQPDTAMELRITEEAPIAKKIAHLERIFIKRLKTVCHIDSIIQKSLSNIYKTKGQVLISSLEKSLGVSSRHLERKFIENVGLSPKMFCRVIRIKNAISILRSQPKPDWTEIAYSGGFYDQAHLIREFKTISGLTPNRYVSECI